MNLLELSRYAKQCGKKLVELTQEEIRQQYGSVNPAGIIAPAIVATFVSTAVVYCKVRE